jgi:flagellar assembly protein FliH
MSSSKVFKKDPHFTPTPLVRRNILPVRKETKFHPAATLPQSSPVAALQTALADPDDVPLAQDEAKGEPEPPIDIEALKQEAYNQGKADLAAQFQMEFQQTLAAFAEGCQKIDSQRKKMLQQSRGDLINLIILLSEKILGQELATPRNIIAATLQSALEHAIESEEYYVTLHPEDLAFAEAKVPEIIADIRGLERIVFKTDSSMIRGGCLLESSVCTVDASIETQLASMKEFLADQPIFIPVPEIDKAVPADQPAEEINPEA